MPARERTPAGAPEDSTYVWMREVTSNMEHLTGRVSLVEKSVDGMSLEVRRATDVAVTAAAAMERIAKAEEDRLREDRARNKFLAEQEKERARVREKWIERVLGSQTTQVFFAALLAGVLNLLGLSYVVRDPVVTVGASAVQGEGDGSP